MSVKAMATTELGLGSLYFPLDFREVSSRQTYWICCQSA
jgi:hypothetical protein